MNTEQFVSALPILPSIFRCCINMFLDWSYYDTCMVSILPESSLIDPLSKEEVFVCNLQYIWLSTAITKVVKGGLNPVIEILCFALLDTGLKVV